MATGNKAGAGRTIVLVLTVLALSAPAAVPSPAAVTSPATLVHAREIRVELNARLRLTPGRKLSVTEVTSMAVVSSLTLVTPGGFRVIPTDDGIYFATCTARARCPYPRRSAAWPVAAVAPRRLALELALRTFLETPTSLVVVLLPTAELVWVVFEREDLLEAVDARLVLDRLTAPDDMDAPARKLVDGLIEPRLFAPVPIVPPPADGSMLAVSVAVAPMPPGLDGSTKSHHRKEQP